MPKPGLALRLGFTLPRGLHRDRAISSTFFLTAGKDRPVAGGIPLPEFGPLDASSSETAKPDGNTDAGQPLVLGVKANTEAAARQPGETGATGD